MKVYNALALFIQRIIRAPQIARLLQKILAAIKKCTYFAKQIIRYVFLKLIPFVGYLVFVLVPFMHNIIPHNWAYIVWGISIPIFVIDGIKEAIDRKKSAAKNDTLEILSQGSHILFLFFFCSAFIANYLDTAYSWKWVILLTVALAMPIGSVNWIRWVGAQDQYSLDKKQRIKNNIFKTLIFYLFLVVFFAGLILESLLFQFLAGGICMIIIFVNLAGVILSGKEFNIWFEIHDLIAGVALAVFLIYNIPNDTLQNIVLTITAALYGGIITLVGVAWTIKDGQNREAETKRLGCMPFLQLEISHNHESAGFCIDLPLTKAEPTNFVYRTICIKNVGNGTAANITYNWKYGVNNISIHDYPPVNAIMQGDSYCFQLTCDADETISTNSTALMTLRYNDLLGHDYEQRIILHFENYDLVRIDNDSPKFLGFVCYLATEKE